MLKVVIIDSSAISRGLLSSILVNGGHEVAGDFSATAAGIARAVKLAPQVICIDTGAADEGGLQLLDALRAALPKAIIFFVSAQLDAATVQQVFGHGAHGFIVKPFNAATVLATIRNTIFKLASRHRSASNAAINTAAIPE